MPKRILKSVMVILSDILSYIFQKRSRLMAAALSGLVALSVAGLSIGIFNLQLSAKTYAASADERAGVRFMLASLTRRLDEVSTRQAASGFKIFDTATANGQLSLIGFDLRNGETAAARTRGDKLSADIIDWEYQLRLESDRKLSAARASAAAQLIAPSALTLNVPILLYHYTPSSFEQQLQTLVARGYTTISLDELTAGFTNLASLPAKPVVLTFDDGYSDQLKAVSLLEKYQMKATFYIITGGAASNWCIGADRHTGIPCGDSYLNWDQIRALDANPLFTIGAHTVDHLHLSSEQVAVQKFQIEGSKATIEAQLGHSIKHFCYPYGSYNATTITLVHEAGFVTATTTAAGTAHRAQDLLTLSRVRDTRQLP